MLIPVSFTVRQGVETSFSSKPARERPYFKVSPIFFPLKRNALQLYLDLVSILSIKKSS